MPIYLYEHPKTKAVKEVTQGMRETHEYTDDKGVKWNRIFTIPQGMIDGKFNCWSRDKFVEKTGKMKGGTIGDLFDASQEMSDRRAKEMGGKDPIKQKYFQEWSAKRKGKRHPQDK